MARIRRRLLGVGLICLLALAIPAVAVVANGPSDNHGTDVSKVARDHSTTGRAHGEAVSEAARANHGADVSAVAKDDSTSGRAHGEAVAAVARGEHGKP
jgi:hypothetical protein